jgi:DNA repair protein RadD
MSILRPYQQQVKDATLTAWRNGAKAVMMQMPTGAGKTVVIGSIATDHAAAPWDIRYPAGCAIAHRSELVGQISQQLAREGVPHGLIASEKTIKGIVANHVEEFGRTFYNARAAWRVASIDTIIKRDGLDGWAKSVGMVFIDEAHHVLRDNKWGKGLQLFPNARVGLPTATPLRADRKGLGRDAHGVADVLIEGPQQRWLIDQGFLTDYKVFCVPPSDMELDGVPLSASGDFSPERLREAVHKSKKIVGDVVDTYIKHARGKLGVTFAVDIESAREITSAFNMAGIPAELLTAEDDESRRRAVIRKFKNRELWQLINCELFTEGFDLPAIECVSFARPTASFALYSQMWGRALRLMVDSSYMPHWGDMHASHRQQIIASSGKPFAFIFDHAGNFYRHMGPPDKPMDWTRGMVAGSKRKSAADDGIPMRVCLNVTCALPYERIYSACPYCGTAAPEPAARGGPATVDGNIEEIDPQLMAQYRGEQARIDGPAPNLPGAAHVAGIRNHMYRQAAQHRMREAVAVWYASHGDTENAVAYRRFWFTFGIDAAQVRTLGTADADAMRQRIIDDLTKRCVTIPDTVTNEMEQ